MFLRKFECLEDKLKVDSYTTSIWLHLTIYMIFLIYIQFDNNRFSSFGDYVSNKNGYRQAVRQTGRLTDRQTETTDYLLYIVGDMKHRGNIKVAIRPMDSIAIVPSLTLVN